jgi:hypothetical protein
MVPEPTERFLDMRERRSGLFYIATFESSIPVEFSYLKSTSIAFVSKLASIATTVIY